MRLGISLRKLIAGVLPLIALTAWAGLMIWFYFDPRINVLTNPFLHRWVLLAGIFLALIVIFRFIEISRNGMIALNCGEECRDSDELTVGKLVVFFTLIIPFFLAIIVTPASFSGQFVRNRGVELIAPAVITKGIPEMTADEVQSVLGEVTVYDTDVIEILMLADDPAARSALEKKEVSFIAQLVYPEAKAGISEKNRNIFYAVRLYMLCCAADARPVGILVRTPTSLEGKEMSWLKISGILNYVNTNGRLVPEVTLKTSELIPTPEEQYLY